MWLYPGSHIEPETADSESAVFVQIHGHCWMDNSHIIRSRVIKKDEREPYVWECSECEVKEKRKPCRRRCAEAALV